MFKKMNERVKRLTVMDIGLIKGAVFFATIIIIKLFPQILRVNLVILIILLIACAVRPFYSFWIRK